MATHPHRRRILVVLLLLSSILFAVPRHTQAQSIQIPTEELILWLDATDPDGDGNPGNNPANNATVSEWVDKSGKGHDAVISSGKAGAKFQLNAFNGLPVLRFDTTQSPNAVYDLSGLDLRAEANPKVTIFTIYRVNEGAPGQVALWGNDDGDWDRFFYPRFTGMGDGVDDGLISLGPDDAGLVIEDAGKTGQLRLLAIEYNGNVSGGENSGPVDGSAVYFDGDLVRTFTDTTSATSGTPVFGLGWDGDGGPFHGDIAEVIIYGRLLTDEERDVVFGALGAKYGLDFGGTPPPQEPSGPQCFTDIDMAVSPQFISLAPGGEATVNVAVRNTNNELQGYNDILVSFSDGLDVVSVSEGGVDLGQRAAWQKFQLEANETREFAVTVRAAEQLVAAPVHITELYCGGRVLERIDGVFITPAPTEAPAVVAPAPAPAPTAVPAPLPVVLPNTAGDHRSGDWSAVGLAVVIVLGAWLLRQRRRA